MRSLSFFGAVVSVVTAAIACSSNSRSSQATGGASDSAAEGGSNAQGGADSGTTGGAPGTGGVSATGGSAGVAGSGATAGAAGTASGGSADSGAAGGSGGAAGSTGGSGLLSGCTVGANNQPSCATPSGWTLVTAQGFDAGAVPSTQTLGGGGVECTVAHTGSCAAGGEYTGGDQRIYWSLAGGQINSLSTYESWWEWDDAQGKLNQDFYMMRRTLNSNGSFIDDAALDILPVGPNNCLFNCTSESIAFGAEGKNGQPSFLDYGAYTSPDWGAWTQWEVELHLSTPGNADGSIVVWRNGVRVYSDTNKNIGGTLTGWATSDLDVGGVYTYLVWWLDSAHTQCASGHSRYTTNYGNWSQPDPCPNQAPPNGHGIPFHRYLDDIIVLKQ